MSDKDDIQKALRERDEAREQRDIQTGVIHEILELVGYRGDGDPVDAVRMRLQDLQRTNRGLVTGELVRGLDEFVKLERERDETRELLLAVFYCRNALGLRVDQDFILRSDAKLHERVVAFLGATK